MGLTKRRLGVLGRTLGEPFSKYISAVSECTTPRAPLIYITEPDKGAQIDIVSAFNSDFQQAASTASIEDIVKRFCTPGETLGLRQLRDQTGFSGYILRPLQTTKIPKEMLFEQLFQEFFGSPTYGRETPHPIIIDNLSIRPDSSHGYYGGLALSDAAGDLHKFLIAVDGEIHRQGTFIQAGSLSPLVELLATTELSVQSLGGELRVKSPEMPLSCDGNGAGKLYGHSSWGVRQFGILPEGKHTLMLYALDKRGNRSFAKIDYDI